MKKMVFALGLLAAVAVAAPSRAHTDFSFAIGLPGFFGVFGGPPAHRPPAVIYAPPVPYYYAPPVPYYPPVVYRPHYRPYYGYGYRGWHDRHHGWHGRRDGRHGRYHR